MEAYAGKQFVGIDLHRRRTVIVRTTEAGEVLEAVRIVNDVQRLASVMARAGQGPEVVLEATYGWYWAVDALQAGGANVHLAHPLGVKAFEYRRVKNDVRDAQDLADLLRMGRLPEAWIAPPPTRELRELVRHRAKLVGLAFALQGRGARRAGQVRGPGADERPVRGGWHRAVGRAGPAGPVRGADRLTSPGDGRPGLRDQRVRRNHPRAAGPGAGVHRGAEDPRHRPHPGCGPGRRDRRRDPVRIGVEADVLGGSDAQAP